jgi:hypothetical protein
LDLNLALGKLSSLNVTDAKDTETLETTIREDGDSNVGEDLVRVLEIKVELFMRSDLALGQDGDPLSRLRDLLVRVGGLKKDGRRVVTLEVSGIDFGLQQVTLITETDDDKVLVVGSARALRFPSVTHVLTTSRQEKVATRSIMLITDHDGMTTVAEVGKINDFRGVLGPDRLDSTVDTETSNTTIGDVVQTNMGINLTIGVVKQEVVVASRGEINLGEDLSPLDILSLGIAFGAESGFDGCSRSLVTSEVAGIDIETKDVASETKLDDSPIVSGVVTLGFPTVHPSTLVGEATRAGQCRLRLDHVLALSKELISDGNDLTTSSGVGQV